MNEMSENLHIAHTIFHPKPSVFTAPDTTHSAGYYTQCMHLCESSARKEEDSFFYPEILNGKNDILVAGPDTCREKKGCFSVDLFSFPDSKHGIKNSTEQWRGRHFRLYGCKCKLVFYAQSTSAVISGRGFMGGASVKMFVGKCKSVM